MMHRGSSARRRGEGGATAVEFALVLPLRGAVAVVVTAASLVLVLIAAFAVDIGS